MAGRQGHNARKGKQGFQEVYEGPPEEFELPRMADDDEDDDVPVQATPKQEASALAFISMISGGMAYGALSFYLPAGGSAFVGWGAVIVSTVATAVAAWKVARYFYLKRKGEL